MFKKLICSVTSCMLKYICRKQHANTYLGLQVENVAEIILIKVMFSTEQKILVQQGLRQSAIKVTSLTIQQHKSPFLALKKVHDLMQTIIINIVVYQYVFTILDQIDRSLSYNDRYETKHNNVTVLYTMSECLIVKQVLVTQVYLDSVFFWYPCK